MRPPPPLPPWPHGQVTAADGSTHKAKVLESDAPGALDVPPLQIETYYDVAPALKRAYACALTDLYV
eukprot:5755877-Prymnesium_polylepis.1